MDIEKIVIPHVGEGLQEVKIVSINKKVGEQIKKDEVLYEIETDKAVMEMESPCDGTVKEWFVKAGDIVPIGAEVVSIESEISGEILPASNVISSDSEKFSEERASLNPNKSGNTVRIPPRVKSYAKQLNIPEDELRSVPASGNKLTTEDVDAYVDARGKVSRHDDVQTQKHAVAESYVDTTLSNIQKTLNYRFKQSRNMVEPAVVMSVLKLNKLKMVCENLLKQDEKFKEENFISEFQALVYCIALTVSHCPKMKTILSSSESLREYKNINLGFAVETVKGELVTAVIDCADKYPWQELFKLYEDRLAEALDGKDQAHGAVQMVLSYMGDSGVEFAIPTLVHPASSILFVGAPYSRDGESVVNLVLTINHNVINGMEAARFLKQLTTTVDKFTVTHDADISEKSNIAVQHKKVSGSQDFLELKDLVIKQINQIINAPVVIDQTFGEQGLDSIKAVALIKSLNEKLKLNLSPVLIWRCPTAEKLIRFIANELKINCPDSFESDKDSAFTEVLVEIESLDKKDVTKLIDELEKQK